MRLFVGIEVDDAVKRYIYDVSMALKAKLGRMRASWVREENYHITLMFIGEVPENEVDIIDEKLSTIDASKFSITLNVLGSFGKPPRVLWLGVEENDTLRNLADQVNKLLGGDTSRFHPHITLARIKSGVPCNFRDTLNTTKVRKATWDVDRFVLFKSTLSPNGSVYTPIKTYALK
jgi:2'-5' RNA ligase